MGKKDHKSDLWKVFVCMIVFTVHSLSEVIKAQNFHPYYLKQMFVIKVIRKLGVAVDNDAPNLPGIRQKFGLSRYLFKSFRQF